MKLTFLENGIDSLKKGFANLIEYENLSYQKDAAAIKKRFYYLKDAIVFVQHGIEILIKQIIQNHSEYLIFSQIDANVKSALKQKNQRKLASVFETDLKHKVHTVTFTEAIERLKIIPSISLTTTLEKRLLELENYRNIIMHCEPHFNETEINSTFEGLSDELDTFFYESIGEKYKTISGYSQLVKNKEAFKKALLKKGLVLKADALETITKAIKIAKISIGSNEVKRFTNINNCLTFLTYIFNSDLMFGTDLYNGYCSGNVTQLKRKENDIIEIYTADNECYFEFKFKSLILYIPEIDNEESPIIFLEADELDFDKKHYVGAEPDIVNNIKHLQYVKTKSGNQNVYDQNKIDKLQKSKSFSSNYVDYVRFFTKGIFCFLNIQGLEYHVRYDELVYKLKFLDGKELEIELRKAFKKVRTITIK